MKIDKQIIREQSEKINQVQELDHVPLTKDEYLKIDKILTGSAFFTMGAEVEIGLTNIDWTGAHIKHQEWPAQLNRFFHCNLLARAYAESRDEKYATVVRIYIEDWLDYRNGQEKAGLHERDNTLNLSIRLGNSCGYGWGKMIYTFLDSPAFDDDFITRMLLSMERQAEYLLGNLTIKGNWRISQLDSLAMLALRFPFLENADKFLARGVKGLQCAFKQQMHSDGVHEEFCPSYHGWMTQVMARYSMLKNLFPETRNLQLDENVLEKALKFMVYSTDAGVNDSTADLISKEDESMLQRVKWYLQKLGFENQADWQPENDFVFNDSGFIFSSSDHEKLIFDVSKWGGAHCHLSRLSLSYRVNGKALIFDPGVLNYETSDPFMPYGKSTRAHSTLNINGLNQSNADCHLKYVDFQDEFMLTNGKFDANYWNSPLLWWFDEGHKDGIYGCHERIVFWKKGDYALVMDLMLAEGNETINNCWQMAPMDAWHMDEQNLCWWSENQDENLYIKMVRAPENTAINCFEGVENPEIRGWVGHRGVGELLAAPLVEFSYPVANDGISAVLFSSFMGKDKADVEVLEQISSPNGHVQYLKIRTSPGNIDHIAWSPGMTNAIEEYGPICSDAPFVWLRFDEKGKLENHYSYQGSFIDFEDQNIFQK